MWSFVVLDLKNQMNVKDFVSFISKNYSDYEILYCSSKKSKNTSVTNLVFDKNENLEIALNKAVHSACRHNIVVIRDIFCYTDVRKLTDNLNDKYQIVYTKKSASKFKEKIRNIIHSVINYLFNQNLMQTTNGLAVFGAVATSVIKSVKNPSLMIRSNNFTGLDFVLVDATCSYKYQYHKKKAILCFCVPLFVGVFMSIAKCVIRFNCGYIGNLLYISTIILCFVFTIIFGCVWFIKAHIGENN